MVFFAPPYIKSSPPTFCPQGSQTHGSHGIFLWKPEPDVSTLRVLHLINGEHFAGAERVQQLLGKRLPEQQIACHFVCLKNGRFPELCGLKPDMVTTLPMKSRFDTSIVHSIRKLLASSSFDLLHAHTPRSAMIASMISRKVGLPWVFHVHSPTARDSTRAWINRLNDCIERWALWNCDHIITVSKSLRREMIRRGYPRTKTTCIPNGVPIHTPIDSLGRREQQAWRVGMAALVRPRKGIEILLQSIARILPVRPQLSVDVIGSFETAEYEKTVRKLVMDLQLEKQVRFVGFTKDVPAAMAQLDALVLPSLFGEGMPMVVLEALAQGIPVVATEVEGTPEVIRHGREGFLAKPGDAQSLAERILEITSDRQRWTNLSQHALARHREKYTDTILAQRTADLYRRVLHERNDNAR